MNATDTEAYGYRVVNGENGDVVAIYAGDPDGAHAANRLAQAMSDMTDVQHYSQRFNY